MPFKLKDSGVSLNYIGEDTLLNGEPADVIQLTFSEVGYTPQNKYLVYVDKKERLVKQWAFFPDVNSPEPGFVLPWERYVKYGNILLSGSRGEPQLTEIAVYNKLPETVFNSFEEPQVE